MNQNYKRALSEVRYIIEQLDEEDFKRIPKKLIDLIEKEKDKKYKVNISFDVPIYNQKLLKETRAILDVIYRMYLA